MDVELIVVIVLGAVCLAQGGQMIVLSRELSKRRVIEEAGGAMPKIAAGLALRYVQGAGAGAGAGPGMEVGMRKTGEAGAPKPGLVTIREGVDVSGGKEG